MNQHNFILFKNSRKTIHLNNYAVLFAGLMLFCTSSLFAQKKAPYNVLFIAVDDLNDWVGVYNKHPDMKTPAMDRLAKQGMLFTRAYCSAPSCNPSRTSLLTGIRPSTSGVYLNNQPWRPVLPTAVTMPQYFTQNNYEVMGTGKIYHDIYNDSASWPVYYRVPPQVRAQNRKKRPGSKGVFDWSPVDVDDSAMSDFKIANHAIAFLQQKHDKPFFLALGITKPHLPWYVPQKYFDANPLADAKRPLTIPNDLDDVPPAGVKLAHSNGDHQYMLENNLWESAVQGYTASISFADAQIARVLDALENSPYKQNTIIVLFGDHGWNLGEKEHWRKYALWEETTHVPFIIVAPGLAKPGSVCERTVNLMDIFPTLIEACHLPVKKGIEAVSIYPLLKNPTMAWNHPSVSTWGQNNHAVRTERWRYIRYSDGTEELYDHNSDPHEWKNLAWEVKYAALKKQLAGWMPKVNAPNAPIDEKVKNGGE